jgi:transcriptional regulator with XRE-family HTH domain
MAISKRERRIVAELLKDMRISAGRRQSEVAKGLGVPQSFVSKYEAGERRLDVSEVRALCVLFGGSLSRFASLYEKRVREEGSK